MTKKIDSLKMDGHNKEFYTLHINVESVILGAGLEHKNVVIEKKSLGLDIDDLPCGCKITIDMVDLENLIHLLTVVQQKHDNLYD